MTTPNPDIEAVLPRAHLLPGGLPQPPVEFAIPTRDQDTGAHVIEDITLGVSGEPVPDTDTTVALEDAVAQPFKKRLLDSLSSVFKEWYGITPEERRFWAQARRTGAAILALVTQGVDRTRGQVLLLPTAFNETLEYTGKNGYSDTSKIALAGLVVGGLSYAWNYMIGKSSHVSINQFPHTTKTVAENHPAMVRVVGKAASGFPEKEELEAEYPEKPEEGYNIGPYDTKKSLWGKIGLALGRGLKTGFLYGNTMQVGLAKTNEHSDKSTKRRWRVASAEAAVPLGLTGAAIGALVVKDYMGAADLIKGVITNKKVLLAAQGVFIAYPALDNMRLRRKEMRDISAEVAEAEPTEHQAQTEAVEGTA